MTLGKTSIRVGEMTLGKTCVDKMTLGKTSVGEMTLGEKEKKKKRQKKGGRVLVHRSIRSRISHLKKILKNLYLFRI